MLIDPHVNPHDVSPDELIDLMIDASVDGAVITCTHDARRALPYVEALLEEDFVALVGVELLTPHGALVFIPKEADEAFFNGAWCPNDEEAVSHEQRGADGELISAPPLWGLEALLARLQGLEGALLVSHPFSRLSSLSWGDRAYTLSEPCAVEVRVGRGLAVRDFLSDEVAMTKGWSRLGSCSGDLAFLGASLTAFVDNADSQAALCDALEKGVCWPIEFERPEHPRARYQGVVEDEGPRRVSLAEKERRKALSEVNRRRPQRGSAPIDQIFGKGPKSGRPREAQPRGGRQGR